LTTVQDNINSLVVTNLLTNQTVSSAYISYSETQPILNYTFWIIRVPTTSVTAGSILAVHFVSSVYGNIAFTPAFAACAAAPVCGDTFCNEDPATCYQDCCGPLKPNPDGCAGKSSSSSSKLILILTTTIIGGCIIFVIAALVIGTIISIYLRRRLVSNLTTNSGHIKL